MQLDALKFLKEMADAASPARRIVKCDQEPPGVYYVEQPGGKLERVTALDPPLRNSAADLDTLARDLVKTAGEGAAEVWYSRDGVVALFSGDPGGDRVAYALSPSPQLALLTTWDRAGRASVSQADLVMLLRTTLADCYPAFPSLLANVRQVKTSKAADVNSQIAHGKVSLGKSVVAEMSGVAAIPEEVTFRVPVFAQAGARCYADVRVAVDPDPQQERFTLVVLPGQVEAAQFAGETWLAARLAELLGEHGGEAIPVYRGTP